MIVSPYETFEARTLQAFEKLYSHFGDSRIDTTVRYLVSKDPRIEDKIRYYLQQNPEYPVIIPITFQAFYTIGNDTAAIDAIRRNYLIRDLFGIESPLKQDYYYFGRDELVNQVIDSHKVKQNSSIFGLRKSGKTSTIFAIQRKSSAMGVRSISIDCEDPEIHAKRYDELLFHIVNLVRKEGGLKSKQFPHGLPPDQVSTKFKDLINGSLNELKSSVLLIFDEIENISPSTASSSHWTNERDTLFLWQIIRSYYQSDTKYYLSFCFVGTSPQLFETPRISDAPNPVLFFASPKYMSGLKYDSVTSMCRRLGFFMGLEFHALALSRLYELFGGHPFFTRQVCSQVHQDTDLSRPRTVNREMIDAAALKSRGRIRLYLEHILDHLKAFYPSEYDLILYLAQEKLDDFYELSREYPELLEHTLGYGILEESNGVYRFALAEVREALSRRAIGSSSNAQEIDAIWHEITSRRNKIEMEIRSQLFLMTRAMDAIAVEKALYASIRGDRIEIIGKNPRTIFSRGTSPLYFLELLKLCLNLNIVNNGDTRIKTAFDIVNKHRAEAHARVISEEDLWEVRDALDVLEDYFLPPD